MPTNISDVLLDIKQALTMLKDAPPSSMEAAKEVLSHALGKCVEIV